jgi:hypothetical protein
MPSGETRISIGDEPPDLVRSHLAIGSATAFRSHRELPRRRQIREIRMGSPCRRNMTRSLLRGFEAPFYWHTCNSVNIADGVQRHQHGATKQIAGRIDEPDCLFPGEDNRLLPGCLRILDFSSASCSRRRTAKQPRARLPFEDSASARSAGMTGTAEISSGPSRSEGRWKYFAKAATSNFYLLAKIADRETKAAVENWTVIT